ncbi:MAG: MotA/TolQ/ExbB proton channel family protein [Fuerstiella sp.]|jgi:biopolymer transport protein ExbB|nr:MotA/TolQ/ExbB proton channel family protein [Fuerstiella sp.]MCP4509570.1 MotA/TolQ/ExbB proton channel family protein [Fuerstiella sp.]MDG2130811.1 MotA/TolQ/ExbB proton channel family protein [Fuerstiella sp.]
MTFTDTSTYKLLTAGTALLLSPAVALAQDGPDVGGTAAPPMPSLWDLAIQGGWFMIPIGVASIVTMAFTMERLVGLRRGRNLPRNLIHKLRELMSDSGMDPRRLWEACEEHRSPLANVVKAAVLKTGRPHAELEKSVEDAVGRETAAMTRNMRPINVVASIAPLLGLLGTVQGMIMAFMVTSTTSSTGTAKAQELAHGIYTALVTTFAGLSVAVFSVVLANFLEGRIERLLRQMEEIFLDLLPQLERYEGRIRIAEATSGGEPGIRVKTVQHNGQQQNGKPETAEPRKVVVPPEVQRQKVRQTQLNRPSKLDATGALLSDVGSNCAETRSPPNGTVMATAREASQTGSLRANFDRVQTEQSAEGGGQ